MTALCIIPQGFIYFSDLCDWQRIIQRDVVLLTSNENRISIEKLKSDYGFHHVETFENYYSNGMIELRAVELHEQYNFDRVAIITEFDVLRAARLRDKFSIEGQGLESARHYRDKYLMRSVSCQAGLPSPKFTSVTSALEISDFIKEVGLPIVIKPRDLAGSVGAHVLRTDEQCKTFFTQHLDDIYQSPMGSIAEQFVEGKMYHVDGIIHNGKEVVVAPFGFINDGFAFSRGDDYPIYSLEDTNPLKQRIIEYARTLIHDVLPSPQNLIFHLELFHTPEDELVLCEIASRMGGGRINDSMRVNTGVDPKMAYLEAEINPDLQVIEPFCTQTSDLAGWMLIPYKVGTLISAPETCPFEWADYRFSGKAGKQYGPPINMGISLASVVVRGNGEKDVIDKLQQVSQWFHAQEQWQLDTSGNQ